MKILKFFLIGIIWFISNVTANSIHHDSLRFRIAKAVRTDQPPLLDGFIEHEVWNKAPKISGFLQTDPVELGIPSEETIVRIIYDDKYIYVGFRCNDNYSEKIKKSIGIDISEQVNENKKMIESQDKEIEPKKEDLAKDKAAVQKTELKKKELETKKK